DHADEKQEMVVTRHRVLRAEVHERRDGGAGHGPDECGVTVRDAVGANDRRPEYEGGEDERSEAPRHQGAMVTRQISSRSRTPESPPPGGHDAERPRRGERAPA